jgi:hypothetical protein
MQVSVESLHLRSGPVWIRSKDLMSCSTEVKLEANSITPPMTVTSIIDSGVGSSLKLSMLLGNSQGIKLGSSVPCVLPRAVKREIIRKHRGMNKLDIIRAGVQDTTYNGNDTNVNYRHRTSHSI